MKFVAILISAIAMVTATPADAACWKRASPDVQFASFSGLNPETDLGLAFIDLDQTYCDNVARLDVFKSVAGSSKAMMCLRGAEAQKQFCGTEGTCCAVAVLEEDVPAAAPVSADSDAAQVVAVPAPFGLTATAQAVSVESASPQLTATTTTFTSDSSTTCWKRTSNFASLNAASRETILATLTTIAIDQAYCKRDERLDVFMVSPDATTGTICLIGAEAQRTFCSGRVGACCADGIVDVCAEPGAVVSRLPVVGNQVDVQFVDDDSRVQAEALVAAEAQATSDAEAAVEAQAVVDAQATADAEAAADAQAVASDNSGDTLFGTQILEFLDQNFPDA